MVIEQCILYGSIGLTLIFTILIVPKDKIREFSVALLFKQTITWMFGLIVIQFRLIEFPYRLFDYATRGSFVFDYIAYPAICAFFNIFYPEGNTHFKKWGYYFTFVTSITVFEVILERYTHLIKYLHWSWAWTWITLFLTFYISRIFFRWFFMINKNQADQNVKGA